MTLNKRVFLVSGAVFFCITCRLFAFSEFEKTGEPNFVPGVEVRVDTDNKYIGGGHFLVYVPADYTNRHNWPVIFFFHGMNGQPKTWPFKQITNGRGFIIVGMEYIQRGKTKRTRRRYVEYVKQERRSILEVKKYLSEHLKIDENHLFITGNSKGGWHTSAMLEVSARAWAGAVILAAGRHRSVNYLTSKANRQALQGKPIYIGVGQKDMNRATAERSVSYYRRYGADVTFEQYKGAGHVFDFTKAKKLYDWLLDNSGWVRIESGGEDKDKSSANPK
jgi:predicted esterase